MAVVAFVLVSAAVVIVRTTETYLIERVDAQLADIPARAFDRITETFPSASPRTFPSRPSLSSAYVARVADDVLTVLSTPNASSSGSGRPKVSPARAVAGADHDSPENFTVASTRGSSGWRVRAIAEPDGGTLVLALSLRDVDASVHRLVLVEMLATGLVIAILGLVTFWVIRLGVRPIKRMTATATAIASGDLSQRVPAERSGTEAGELGDALNTMLSRIEDAFDQRSLSEARLRQFVADASHELRTPVTTIRGYAELYRQGGLKNEAELGQAMRRTEQETVRMGSLVDDLLLLARLDEGRPLQCAPLDLGVIAVDAAADARVLAPDRSIEAAVAEGVTVHGDEDRIRQVLANLVANALLHTPDSAPVVVRVRTLGSRGVVEVQDEGPGLLPEHAARAFERFWRADASRSRNGGGSGLGLAIVKAIAEAHGGTASFASAIGVGTTVRVELPLAQGAPARSEASEDAGRH
ncbi:MAG: HAMP domain-containing sensor histidine kinase [Acidimicrobiia bacterium]